MEKLEIKINNKVLCTDRPAFVMGIVNATDDSFFAGSRGGIDRALQLIDEGADIIDVGGESTRPGFHEVSAEEEINRVVPLISEIRRRSSRADIVISIDTRKASVFKAAFDAGADLLNDVTALEFDKEMGTTAAKTGVSVVLMHQGGGDYNDVNEYLRGRIKFAVDAGISKEKLILDPGIGFGKTNEESINLIKNTDKMCIEGLPLLMALSRKRCIGEMTGRDTDQRMAGTLAADMISVQRGAKIVRVHDVIETIDMLNVMKYL